MIAADRESEKVSKDTSKETSKTKATDRVEREFDKDRHTLDGRHRVALLAITYPPIYLHFTHNKTRKMIFKLLCQWDFSNYINQQVAEPGFEIVDPHCLNCPITIRDCVRKHSNSHTDWPMRTKDFEP